MPRGTIYYSEITFSYRKGNAKQRHLVTIKSSCVGYSAEDALERLQRDPEKAFNRHRKALKGLGKTHDQKVDSIKVIHESGLTVYDLETGRPINLRK